MKKIYLFSMMMVMAIASTTQIYAQAIYQLPNGGFEDWTEAANVEPPGWNSFPSNQCDLPFPLSFGCGATKGSQHEKVVGRSGEGNALRIYSTVKAGIVANGNMTTGQIRVRSTDATNAENYNRLVLSKPKHYKELTGTPDSVTFWSKFNPKDGTQGELARFCAVLFGDKGGKDGYNGTDPHYAKAEINYAKTNNEWIQLSAPFTYDENSTNKTKNANGNYYLLLSMTTNSIPGKQSDGDEAFFDDIEFVYSAWLDDVKIKNVSVPRFNGRVLEQEFGTKEIPSESDIVGIAQAADVSQITVQNFPNENGEIVGSYSLITVIAEDQVTTKQYKLNYRLPFEDNKLSALSYTVDNGATSIAIPGFDPEVLEYTVALEAEILSLPTIDQYTVNHTSASISSLTQPATANAAAIIVVKSEAGTERTYTVNFTKAPSTNNLLSDLKVDETTIEGFDPATESYTYNITSCSALPVVTAVKAGFYSSIEITQSEDGKAAATVVVTAENGDKKTYVINMVLSSDAALSTIALDNVALTDFDPETLTYAVELDAETTTFPTLSYQVNMPCATVVEDIHIPGISTLTATAADGSKRVYTINITKTISTNNLLSDLKVDDVGIEGFDPAVESYNYNVVSCTDIPVIDATKASTYANITITQAADAQSAATVVVTAEDGSVKTYTIQMVAINNNAFLSDIQVDGATIANFDPETLSYDIVFEEGYTGTPVVEYTADCALSTIVLSAINCPGITTIDVTAADGTTVNRYALNFSILTDINSSSVAKVTLYPNPVKDYMVVSMPTSEENIINIFDQAGRKVYNARHNGAQVRINTSDLTSGLYILEVNGQKIKFNK